MKKTDHANFMPSATEGWEDWKGLEDTHVLKSSEASEAANLKASETELSTWETQEASETESSTSEKSEAESSTSEKSKTESSTSEKSKAESSTTEIPETWGAEAEVSVMSMLVSIVGSIKELQETVGDMNKRLKSVENNQTLLSKKLDVFRGETNERIFRAKLAHKYGETFAKPFNVQGLFGLARLVLPKKSDEDGYDARALDEVPNFHLSEIQRMEKCVKKFIDFIYLEASQQLIEEKLLKPHGFSIDDVFKKSTPQPNKSKSGKKKSKTSRCRNHDKGIRDKIAAFARADETGKKDLLRQDNGVAMLFFTAASAVAVVPIHELELDCRGKVIKTSDNSYLLQIGEIKSSRSGLHDAVRKAGTVLSVLERALQLSVALVSKAPDTAASQDIEVAKLCVVALPSSERDSSKSPPITSAFQLAIEYI